MRSQRGACRRAHEPGVGTRRHEKNAVAGEMRVQRRHEHRSIVGAEVANDAGETDVVVARHERHGIGGEPDVLPGIHAERRDADRG